MRPPLGGCASAPLGGCASASGFYQIKEPRTGYINFGSEWLGEGIFYHQGTQVVEKSFNPTWVGALQFYLYLI